ncbi:MAG: hypothetical protein U0M37_01645 [Blautia sp.]
MKNLFFLNLLSISALIQSCYKQAIRVTRLGEMLMEDGRKEGRKEGIENSRRKIVLNMLSKKQFSYEEIADLVDISVEKVKEIERETLVKN